MLVLVGKAKWTSDVWLNGRDSSQKLHKSAGGVDDSCQDKTIIHIPDASISCWNRGPEASTKKLISSLMILADCDTITS